MDPGPALGQPETGRAASPAESASYDRSVNDPDHRPAGAFLTTRWSVVLAAGGVEATTRSAALDELCNAYWFPLYAYLRRSGRSADSAAEIVQEFFVLLLSRNDLRNVDPQRELH